MKIPESAWIPTLWKLGRKPLAKISLHRFKLKSGFYARQTPVRAFRHTQIPVLKTPALDVSRLIDTQQSSLLLKEGIALLEGMWTYFENLRTPLSFPPPWEWNPYLEKNHPQSNLHWTQVKDFHPEASDIKIYWELSRMGWAPLLARCYVQSRESRWLDALNALMSDWMQKHPPFQGPQWKCAQECSIRALHLLLCHKILKSSLTASLEEFLIRHAERVELTLAYAQAQQNNHALSEATFLFHAGQVLQLSSSENVRVRGRRWSELGKNELENLVLDLFEADGTFSQYSTNYHRLALDLLSHAADVSRTLPKNQQLSEIFHRRAEAALYWLYARTDPLTGHVPNIGANDGAHILRLDSLETRDFRPSLQTAAALFCNQRLYPEGPWDEPLRWRNLPTKPFSPRERHSLSFSQGGDLTLIASPDEWALLRTPRFRFRPSHSDVLHFDLWKNGTNILRDSGSYSYAHPQCHEAFSGVRAHNTVEIDQHSQMPRLGRFLWGSWPRVFSQLTWSQKTHRAEAHYRDAWGNTHHRLIEYEDGIWRIRDTVTAHQEAILRWHLAPANWRLNAEKLESELGEIRLTCLRGNSHNLVLTSGEESTHYLQKKSIPLLEASAAGSQLEWLTEIQCR